MLTDGDLKKIGQIVDDKINGAIDKKVGNLIDQKLKPIKADISEIRKDVKGIVAFFDSEYLGLRSRVERIEEHLNLKPQSRN